MDKLTSKWVATLASAVTLFAVIAIARHGSRPHPTESGRPKALSSIQKQRSTADRDLLAHPVAATTEYRHLIASHRNDPDPKIQDEVGAARIRMGYALAATDGYKAARSEFIEAARDYKGSGEKSADFGGVTDQAKYQAAVCLLAEGDREGAKKEFLAFLHDEPLSPLCQAVYRRLVTLNGGKSTHQLDGLLQSTEDARERHIRFETSVCGPKCIEHLVADHLIAPTVPGSDATYQSVAKLCGTNDKGTSIEGMRAGLRALGIESYAYLLNARDLARAPLPAIILEGDHYLVLEKEELGKGTFFDPSVGQTVRQPLPKEPSFSVPTILFKEPNL